MALLNRPGWPLLLGALLLLEACGSLSLKDQELESDQITDGSELTRATTESCTAVCDGLVAYYPFFGNAHDTSGNSLDAQVLGAELTTDRDGNENRAYRFNSSTVVNSTTTHIELPLSDLTSHLEQADYTLVAWVKPESVPSGSDDNWNAQGILFTENDGYGLRYHYRPVLEMSNHLYDGDNEGLDWGGQQAGEGQAPGTYYHVAGVVSTQERTTRIYINGEAAGWGDDTVREWDDEGYPDPQQNPKQWLIGTLDSATLKQTFDGVIDEVRMYNRALSSSEIQQLYRGEPEDPTPTMRKTTAFCSRICTGLVVYLPFMGSYQDVDYDTFSNPIDSNQISIIDEFNTVPTLTSDRDRVANAAYFFDGFSDSLTLKNMNTVLSDNASFTVALTAKLENTSSFPNLHAGTYYTVDTLIRNVNYGISVQYHRYEDGGNNLWFTVGNSGAGEESAFSGNTDPLIYNHIVGVADASAQTISLYANGKLLDVKVWDGESQVGTDWYLSDGNNISNSHFGGVLDEVRIYNRALSAEEVQQLYGP